jgi:hypothetical protein
VTENALDRRTTRPHVRGVRVALGAGCSCVRGVVRASRNAGVSSSRTRFPYSSASHQTNQCRARHLEALLPHAAAQVVQRRVCARGRARGRGELTRVVERGAAYRHGPEVGHVHEQHARGPMVRIHRATCMPCRATQRCTQPRMHMRFPAALRGEQPSVATPRAARGWTHPPCRHFKIQSCDRLGSAFEWRLSKP